MRSNRLLGYLQHLLYLNWYETPSKEAAVPIKRSDLLGIAFNSSVPQSEKVENEFLRFALMKYRLRIYLSLTQ